MKTMKTIKKIIRLKYDEKWGKNNENDENLLKTMKYDETMNMKL